MSKPICVKCKNDMTFYPSMCTFACLKCHYHIKMVAFSEKEALEKMSKRKEEINND